MACMPFAIAYSMCCYPAFDCDPVHPFWQRLGAFIFDIFGRRILRYVFPNDSNSKRAADDLEGNGPLEDMYNIEDANNPACSIVVNRHEPALDSFRKTVRERTKDGLSWRTCLCSILFLPFILAGTVLFAISVLACTAAAFALAVPLISNSLLCVLLVFIAGNHVAVVCVVLFDVVVTLLDVNVGADWRSEVFVALFFLIPLGMTMNERFHARLLAAVLAALRRDLGPDHRLSRLSHLFSSIPIDGKQGALKVYNSSRAGMEAKVTEAKPSLFYVISVDEPNLNDSHLRFFHMSAEHQLPPNEQCQRRRRFRFSSVRKSDLLREILKFFREDNGDRRMTLQARAPSLFRHEDSNY